MSPQAPTLPKEILEEIFLRLPPDEPESLMRASLTSKLWLSHLSSDRFRGLYCKFHGSTPMLGFIYMLSLYRNEEEEELLPLFVPTTKFSARTPNNWGNGNYQPLDCRHGRVLLVDDIYNPKKIFVWDPITGSQRELQLPTTEFFNYGIAVLCAETGCDHQSCHEGPCRVVFFGLTNGVDGNNVAYARVYFWETGDWGKQESNLDLGIEVAFFMTMPPIVIENTVYLMISSDYDFHHIAIISYNLASNCLSLIDVPLYTFVTGLLMAMEDGSLGYAQFNGLILYMWSRRMGEWTQYKVIDLNGLIPIQSPINRARPVGSVEGRDIIFLKTNLGIYEINLKSLLCKKLWNKEEFLSLIPYMSFNTPQGKSMPAKKGESLL